MKAFKIISAVLIVAAILAWADFALAQAVGQTAASASPVAVQPVTISVGTWAGDVLMWATTAFGTVISGFVVKLLVALAKKAGVDATDALRARLNEIVLNGLNLAASTTQRELRDKSPIAIRSAAISKAIEYTQAHGDETIKALGLDPTSGAAVEAIRARAETLINDPNVSTPGIPAAATTPPISASS